jgi:hypothetical protein
MRLADKPALYRVVFDSRAEEVEGRIAVDCTSADRVHRTARLMPGWTSRAEPADGPGAAAVLQHPPSWGFPELVEYRLLDAVDVRR